jgi:2-C-methyl-D-erythritol 4-phosphate cytidylyltransferase
MEDNVRSSLEGALEVDKAKAYWVTRVTNALDDSTQINKVASHDNISEFSIKAIEGDKIRLEAVVGDNIVSHESATPFFLVIDGVRVSTIKEVVKSLYTASLDELNLALSAHGEELQQEGIDNNWITV